MHRSLVHRYDNPFEVEKAIRNVAYRLKLSKRYKLYPTFYNSFLKPFYKDLINLRRARSKRAPPTIRH